MFFPDGGIASSFSVALQQTKEKGEERWRPFVITCMSLPFNSYLHFQCMHLATIISVSTATITLSQLILSVFRAVPATQCIRVSPAITRGATHGALKRHLPLSARAYFHVIKLIETVHQITHKSHIFLRGAVVNLMSDLTMHLLTVNCAVCLPASITPLAGVCN
jgi:hypothetical protein